MRLTIHCNTSARLQPLSCLALQFTSFFNVPSMDLFSAQGKLYQLYLSSKLKFQRLFLKSSELCLTLHAYFVPHAQHVQLQNFHERHSFLCRFLCKSSGGLVAESLSEPALY